ncbi:glycosyltransferase [Planctomicrobium piriforme]|uniref:Glycosyltransferase involved in cell wall bisynthesis n=1 Tax=Planctomicrobium piriforme TaxID=1576369 RepID=A0A1I3HWT0_9PLAN|nr:glycosyltransferase [Planctomicrobium piriforme]SFI40206.1 Glycosyltransferase involved in cell wall bisynthesis [Planctomicrobium piriforme]
MTNSAPIEVSFVIPARNEEAVLAQSLASVQTAASAAGVTFEIIVSNDDSTDRTREIALAAGAQVVDVKLHNIGAVRNAGAALATGRILFFLDADTLLPAKTLQAALRAIDAGAVGGGGAVVFEEGLSSFQLSLAALFTWYWQNWNGWAAGCNIFVKRADFEAIGGFDTQYFAAEERYLSDALKTRGRFVILKEGVITSARKLRIYSTSHMIKVALKALIWNRGQLKRREGLEILYDAPREAVQSPESSVQSQTKS